MLSQHHSATPVIQQLRFVIRELLGAVNDMRRSHDSCAAARLRRVAALLREDHTLRHLAIPDPPASADLRTKTGLSPGNMRRLVAHIQTHLEKAIRIQELADIADLSVAHFSRAFKRSFGSPPQQYVVHIRIGRARELMWTTDASLAQIALACGFADQAHFSRVFRRYEGETPGAWRRMRALGRDQSHVADSPSPGECIHV